MTGEATSRVEVDRRVRTPGDRARILITNDDGIGAPGIRILAAALAQVHDVIVVAPEDESSGSGTGIGYFDPSRGVDVTPVELAGVESAYALAGPPGLAVMSAMLGAFGEVPDLVVSGINAGINTGHSVVHSGTVGAVLTARTFGVAGLAVSLAVSDPWHWETAARLACACVDWMAGRKDGSSTFNLNVPGTSAEELKGVRWADLDEFGYFRVAIADMPGQRVQFEVGPQEARLDPGSDTALLLQGFATLTPLTTVEPAPFPSVSPPQID
ncbi:MAG TPA: 5'/3'-nucleotidase SurE [Acidimicrobiia bacterium]|nr:5'/3'-nucleotidase SurE [Acidimicrobiia bacterium]